MTSCLSVKKKKKNRKILIEINSSYFSKMVLHNSRIKIGLQHEQENLDVKKVDIRSTHEKSRFEAMDCFNL